MSEDIIAKLVLTLQQHSTLTLLFVFLIAFSESLIIVGLIVPGAVLMIIIGALIAMNALDFWPAVVCAILGAISGDSLSYWLGKRYQYKLQTIWPLSRHPELMDRANAFFQKHGVKSIVLSRFIGLLRPVIPAVAGMSKMPGKIFLSANIGSAIIWAPLYLLPGLLFGLSIEMASEFAGKFILLVIFLLLIIIFALWAIQRLYVFSKPYQDKAITWLLNWGQKHEIAGEVPAAIFDKSHPELRGLIAVAVIIFILTVTLNQLYHGVIIHYDLLPFDINSFNQLIYHRLQALRSPPFDNIMLWLSYISSTQFIALLYFFLGSFLIYKKDLFSLWHWLAAITLPLLLTPWLGNSLTSKLQENLNLEIQSMTFASVISALGFLTVIINSGLSFSRQKIIYYLSATLVLFLMLSQLYFAQQVVSQVITGLIIGLLWFNLLAIAYRRHSQKTMINKNRKWLIIITLSLLIYPFFKTIEHDDIHLADDDYQVMGTASWLETGWELLPVKREGINSNKNSLFNLQWLGTQSEIATYLSQNGFVKSKNTAKSLSNWFLDNIKINQLPILPHIHKGEYESLRYYRYEKGQQELTVIRLWQSKYKLTQDKPLRPLWFGNVSFMKLKNNLGVSYLVTKEKAVKQLTLANKNLTINAKVIPENRIIFLLK